MEHDDKLAHDAEFARWYRSHHDRIRALCARILRDPIAAEDVAQETLLRAWERREQMREEDLGAWLSVVARNLCLSMLRKDGRLIVMDELPERADVWADPAIEVGRRESRRHVRKALGLLGERSRRVIDLREVREADYDEIGSELGVSAEGARAIAFRARRVLREHLAAVGEGFSGIFIGVKIRVRSWSRHASRSLEAWAGTAMQAGLSLTLVVGVGTSGAGAPALRSVLRNGAVPAVAAPVQHLRLAVAEEAAPSQVASSVGTRVSGDKKPVVNRQGEVSVLGGRDSRTGIAVWRGEPDDATWFYPHERQVTWWLVDSGIATVCDPGQAVCDVVLPEENP